MAKRALRRTIVILVALVMAVTGADFCAAATTYTIQTDTVKVDGSRFDVRLAAGEKSWGYDTIQGACSYDGYAYMSLYNRQKEKIKIAKVDLATMQVVQKSGVIGCTCHANSLTYNPIKNTIVICRGKGGRKSIAIVDATTLKLKKTKTISISRSMAGGTYYGIAAIAYNAEKDLYVAKLRGDSNKIVLLTNTFQPKKRVKISGNRGYLMPQGLYTEGNFMYDVQSFRGSHKYNLVTVRNVKTGELLGRMKIASGTSGQLYELENLFHEGDQWYISFYRAKVRKSGDRDRKNYLCRITVPDKLQPPVPEPVVEEEISEEITPEENNTEITENSEGTENKEDNQGDQVVNPQILEEENNN